MEFALDKKSAHNQNLPDLTQFQFKRVFIIGFGNMGKTIVKGILRKYHNT